MSPENTAHLFKRYPIFFRGHNRKGNPMRWAFMCGDGWFHIIDALASKIEAECRHLKEGGTSTRALPKALQVKEKFGVLRISARNTIGTVVWEWIVEAEKLSSKTCEKCGAPGELRDGGLLVTRCEKCFAPKNGSGTLKVLHGSVARYDNPNAPIASDDWDMGK